MKSRSFSIILTATIYLLSAVILLRHRGDILTYILSLSPICLLFVSSLLKTKKRTICSSFAMGSFLLLWCIWTMEILISGHYAMAVWIVALAKCLIIPMFLITRAVNSVTKSNEPGESASQWKEWLKIQMASLFVTGLLPLILAVGRTGAGPKASSDEWMSMVFMELCLWAVFDLIIHPQRTYFNPVMLKRFNIAIVIDSVVFSVIGFGYRYVSGHEITAFSIVISALAISVITASLSSVMPGFTRLIRYYSKRGIQLLRKQDRPAYKEYKEDYAAQYSDSKWLFSETEMEEIQAIQDQLTTVWTKVEEARSRGRYSDYNLLVDRELDLLEPLGSDYGLVLKYVPPEPQVEDDY